MASSLSNFVKNLAEGIAKIKCTCGHDEKKCESSGIKYRDHDCFLECTNIENDLMEYKCLCCNKYYQNTVTFSNNDINSLFRC